MASGTADVSKAVKFAKAEGLDVAVKCGGHSAPGWCLVNDGLVIDMSLMCTCFVDPATKRAIAAGERWGAGRGALHAVATDP